MPCFKSLLSCWGHKGRYSPSTAKKMDASLDEFLADYFGSGDNDDESIRMTPLKKTFDHEHSVFEPSPVCAASKSKFNTVANFDLRADLLDDSDYFNRSQMTTMSSEFESQLNETASEPDLPKIISVRARRKSMSYDIVFSPPRSSRCRNEYGDGNGKSECPPKISIRIHAGGSMIVQQTKGNPEKSRLSDVIEDDECVKIKEENLKLKEKVILLQTKLEDAHQTIKKLEVEVANLFCQ